MVNNKGCTHQKIIYFDKPEFSYVLGALVGDGCIQKNMSRLGVKDNDFAINFKRNAIKINLRAKVIRMYEKGRFKYYLVRLNSRRLYSLLQKSLKGDFVNADFVNGFFDAEGSALFYKYGRKNIVRFMIYNTDRVLLEKIRRFFLKHEIDSKIYSHKINEISKIDVVNHIVHRNEPYIYCLKVRNDKLSMLNFCHLFKFSIKRKEEARLKIKNYYMTRKEAIRVCKLCGAFTDHYAHDLCEKCYKIDRRDELVVYLRKYYKKNKNILLSKQRKYYKHNAERIAVRGKEYYQSHKEHHAKSCRAYYLKNRIKINAYQREWARKRRAKVGR